MTGRQKTGRQKTGKQKTGKRRGREADDRGAEDQEAPAGSAAAQVFPPSPPSKGVAPLSRRPTISIASSGATTATRTYPAPAAP